MSEPERKNDRRRFLILFILLITTGFSAVLAGLQAEAGIRADQANIQSQYYAVLTSAELYRNGQQVAFDIDTLSTHLRHLQESSILELSALELEGFGNQDGAARLHAQARTAAARAEVAKQVSLLFANPRYAPSQPDDFPDLQAYMSDSVLEANALVAKQNAAVEDYHFWDDKANSYLTILSLLALVFFLLGIAQNSRKLGSFFAIAASVILLACGFATLWNLIS